MGGILGMRGICGKTSRMSVAERLYHILLVTGASSLYCRIPIAGTRSVYRKGCRVSLTPLRLRIDNNLTVEWIENTSAGG